MKKYLEILILVLFIISLYFFNVEDKKVCIPILHIQMPSLCMFKNITGWPCPGCGFTRSLILSSRFDFISAFKYHIAGPFIFLFLLLLIPLKLYLIIRRKGFQSLIGSKSFEVIMYVLVSVILISWIVKIFNCLHLV